MSGERVLVVDDYDDARELYGEYLRFVGFDAITAADGEEALRCVTRGGCDIVILDLALPKFDGLAVLRQLRGAPATKTLPVIILSASVGPAVQQEALAAGANRFLTKPCGPDELVNAIREILTARASGATDSQET